MSETPKSPPPKKPSRWSRFLDGLGEALGEYLFGGGR
jgi:hypothetical protein